MMPPRGRSLPRLYWPAILLALVILLGLAAVTGITSGLDRTLMTMGALREGRNAGPLIEVVQWITWTGDAAQRTVITFVLAAVLVWRRLNRSALVLLVAPPLAGVVSSLLKEAFARERPEIVPHLDVVTSLSYPSGHAVNAMSALLLGALLLARTRRGLWIALALFGAAMIGASRLLLGVHYPTDIVGGWMLGAAAALVAWRIALKAEPVSVSATPEPLEESPGQ